MLKRETDRQAERETDNRSNHLSGSLIGSAKRMEEDAYGASTI